MLVTSWIGRGREERRGRAVKGQREESEQRRESKGGGGWGGGGQMVGEDRVGEVEELALHMKTVCFSLKDKECSFGYYYRY